MAERRGLPKDAEVGDALRPPLKTWLSPADEDIMTRVQVSADPRAFALLVNRWEGPVKRLCARMTGNVHAAEDLAQEVFTKVFQYRLGYRRQARFSTYLWRVAINACLDERRRRTKAAIESLDAIATREEPAALLEDERTSPHESAAAGEEARAVRSALMTLDEDHRAVVVLRHYEGLKFREIAAVLDIPEGTVKSRMAKALTRLAGVLKPLDQRA